MTWVSISAEEASGHTAYGIKGAAKTLKVLSLLISTLGFFSAYGSFTQIVQARNLNAFDYVLLMPAATFVMWSGLNVVLLDRMSKAFVPSFLAFLAAGPFISIGVSLVWLAGTSTAANSQDLAANFIAVLLSWGIWALVWAPYVLLSKRINVTIYHRVRPKDPLLGSPPTGASP